MLRTVLRAVMVAVWAVYAMGQDAGPPTADLPFLGRLVGKTLVAEHGVKVQAFLGIPYAAPPVGEGRWQAPGEVRGWWGVRNATEFGNTCMGSKCVGSVVSQDSRDSEDCLYLNVYTPVTTDKVGNEGPWPVMFWIHGGAFDNGCSNQYDGQQLAARATVQGEPVVVVTINYRLNLFGFMGSDSMREGRPSESVGNYGIADQRAALRFMQAYAGAFNGDASRVTIFGESAGAGSVTNHLVQRDSFGLFQNAVAESGFAPTWCSKPLANADTYYQQVLAHTGCADYACLRAANTTVLMAAHAAIPALPTDVYIGWAPVEDGVVLTADPETLLAAGKFAKDVNILKGTNRDEYALFLPLHMITYQATQLQFEVGVMSFLPTTNATTWLAELTELYSADVYPYYPPVPGVLNATHYYWALVRSLTDQQFYCPGRRAGRHLAGDGSVKVFTYHLRQSILYGGVLVPHTSDIPYVFNCSGAGSVSRAASSYCTFASQPQMELAGQTSGYWITFANTRTLPAPWEELGCEDPDTMLVLDVDQAAGGSGLHTIADYAAPQCEFWDRVLAAQNGDTTAQPFAPRPTPPPRFC